MANVDCWYRYTSDNPPPVNERVLVSDGETIAIARYLSDQNEDIWLFDSGNFKDLPIIWWQNLPEKPPVVKIQE